MLLRRNANPAAFVLGQPARRRRLAHDQGLALVHFSAQPEPCLTQK
jgi:hypothetical protein